MIEVKRHLTALNFFIKRSPMNKTFHIEHETGKALTGTWLRLWRMVQVAVFMIGAGIFTALILFPETGIHAFWNVLIPVAPALFVLATGVWRNVCPLGSVSLLPRHLGISKRRRLNLKWQGRLHLAGVCLLFLIVPLRHLIFETNGPATAALLAATALAAFVAGCLFDWKSGWCSGLCPVHPVEKMYGENVLFTTPNAHCTQCANCVIPCPDSTPAMSPAKANMRKSHRISTCLLTGGLPGFIWGWFHVPDYGSSVGWSEIAISFAYPWLGLAVSLAVYLAVRFALAKQYHSLLNSLFAASAVACYYWYRLPALIGYGLFPGDGMLFDLTASVPHWTVWVVQIIVAAFFYWWVIFRKQAAAEWVVRPPFAQRRK